MHSQILSITSQLDSLSSIVEKITENNEKERHNRIIVERMQAKEHAEVHADAKAQMDTLKDIVMQLIGKGVTLAPTAMIPTVSTATIPVITNTTSQDTYSTVTNCCNFNTSVSTGRDPISQEVSKTPDDCKTKISANTIDSIDNRSQELVPTSSNAEQQSDDNDGVESDSDCYTPK